MDSAITLCPIVQDGSVKGCSGELPDVARDVLRAIADMYRDVGFEEPWICYLALKDGIPVGTCGFKSPPRARRVEIAYFTFPDFEGRGFATAMASELVALARRRKADISLAAQTLPEPGASHRILKKLGFQHVDTIEHPEDGRVWEWRLTE